MFSIGIVGLPNTGKSTLFNALTKLSVPVANYPFTTIKPHKGIICLKDERLERLKEILKPKKITPVLLEFVDIAGLVKNAHLGEGLGNQFLSHIQEVDLILEVVRLFEDKKVSHPEKTIDGKRDVEIIKKEIIERDKRVFEKQLKEVPQDELETKIINQAKEALNGGVWLYDLYQKMPFPEKEMALGLFKKMGFLSPKPIIFLFNINKNSQRKKMGLALPSDSSLFLNAKEEMEGKEFSKDELKELGIQSMLDHLVLTCYNKLDLVAFYTIKGEEVRANEVPRGSNILEAAKKVHSDFEEKFKRAEVINFKEFERYGSWQKSKEAGKLMMKGRDYVVKDGDILEFKT